VLHIKFIANANFILLSLVGLLYTIKFTSLLQFNPKTVFWTNVGKIVDLFLKNTSLDLSGTRLGYFS